MKDTNAKLGQPLFKQIIDDEVTWHYSYKKAGAKRLATYMIMSRTGRHVDPSNETKRLKVSFVERHVTDIQYYGAEVKNIYKWWDFREVDREKRVEFY